jgi:hypothetical protein
MADSVRKQIVDKIMQRLDGGPFSDAPTIYSGRLNKNRSIPIGRDELPMYSVYFIHEAPQAVGNPRRPVILDRRLTIETRIIVRGTDDDADPHCQWVTSQLGNPEPITAPDGKRLTLSIAEGETVFAALEGSEGKVLNTAIRWVVEYKTLPADMTKVSAS